MKELIYFAVVYPPEDAEIAIVLCEQLRLLGFKNGDLYPSRLVPDLDTLNNDVIGRFFIASKSKIDETYKNARNKLTSINTPRNIPVWLSPGKNKLLDDDEANEAYFAFSSIAGVVAYKKGTDDLDYVGSTEFKVYLHGIVYNNIQLQMEAETKRRREEEEVNMDVESRRLPGDLTFSPETARNSIDVLGHEKFANKITSTMIKSPDFDTPATIGIFAPWGSGKTRFINMIKDKCQTGQDTVDKTASKEPGQTEEDTDTLYIAQKDVNCCGKDTCCRWWCKLAIWTSLLFMLTVAIITGIVALSVHPSFQPCTSKNTTSQGSHVNTTTNITSDRYVSFTTPETERTCLESDTVKYYWYYPTFGVIGIMLLVCCTACCQRKVKDDCVSTCFDCCCCCPRSAPKNGCLKANTSAVDKSHTTFPPRNEIEMTSRNGRTAAETEQFLPKQPTDDTRCNRCSNLKKKKCAINCCLDAKAFCYMTWFSPGQPQTKNISTASGEPQTKDIPTAIPKSTQNNIQVIIVDFNAWEYSGCDYLWAGIVTTLGNTVEEYFGKWKVRLCRLLLNRTDESEGQTTRSYSLVVCHMRYKLYMLFMLALCILAVATTVVVFVATEYSKHGESLKTSQIWIAASTLLVTLTALSTAFGIIIKNLMTSTESLVNNLSQEMRGQDFNEELGFMHKIKEEVQHITNIVNFMSRLYNCQFRVLLVIDDLDRCQPDRIMGVLSAVSLLLEPKTNTPSPFVSKLDLQRKSTSPFVSILAIDPRVILGAIERHFDPDNRQDYTQANVNGYEYLKKIIHMPFCLPPPTQEEKREYINTLWQQKPDIKQPGLETKQQHRTHSATGEQNTAGAGDAGATADVDDVTDHPDGATHAVVKPTVPSEDKLSTGDLMQYVKEQLQEESLLKLLHGNPRCVKRICNIILLALSVFSKETMTRSRAFQLLLVVIMVEQWPFRTSFLLQYHMNRVQREMSKKLSEKSNNTIKIGGIEVIRSEENTQAVTSLDDDYLDKAWEREKSIVLEIDTWRKFLAYDWDPELFQVYIETYRLKFHHLKDYIQYAVNHDINIEYIVEQGLAELDLRRKKEEKDQ